MLVLFAVCPFVLRDPLEGRAQALTPPRDETSNLLGALMSKSKTYNNVPMSDELAEAVARDDEAWTGPKLMILNAVVLGAAFILLWCCANDIIGPTINQ